LPVVIKLIYTLTIILPSFLCLNRLGEGVGLGIALLGINMLNIFGIVGRRL